MKAIDIEKVTVSKVFSEWYSVPSFQRHYVWDEDNINVLLDDIKDNYLEHKDNEYFLGSYIIQRHTDSETNDLLDGQQRITTFFLLFAYLRDRNGTPEEVKEELQDFVYQKAKIVLGITEKVRLNYEIRGNVKDFIQKYIDRENSIGKNWKEFKKRADNLKENESIRHICRAILCFKDYFDKNEVDLVKFITFICNNIVMIHISADTLEDAFRLFSIMNDRGVRLSNSDILKSLNLEQIQDAKDINRYAMFWENLQSDLGNDFDRFLSYVRTLYAKTKAKVGLLDEFKLIFKENELKRGKPFFDAVKEWYEVYRYVIEMDANESVAYCNFINIVRACPISTDWIPVLMRYYKKFQNQRLLEFIQKLIHKTVADIVCGESPSKRIENMNKFLPLIEDVCDPAEVLNKSNYFAFSKEIFLTKIQDDMYGKVYAKILLLLLEYKYQDNSIPKSFSNTFSIEHILPQNPNENSQWSKIFTNDEQQEMTHKLGNLCLIGRRKNSMLSNLDYKQKMERYFQNNIGNFARTLNIYHTFEDQWTPVEYKKCMEQSIKDLKEIFEISD